MKMFLLGMFVAAVMAVVFFLGDGAMQINASIRFDYNTLNDAVQAVSNLK